MSWGTRIAILYLGFVALILTLAFTCFGQKSELESKDYYAKELKFQNQIDATSNANNLDQPIMHEVKGRTVQLMLPKQTLTTDFKGSVYFLRPSDSSKDVTIQLQPNAEGKVTLNDASFVRGVYKMQISFISAAKNYFKEDIIFLQ